MKSRFFAITAVTCCLPATPGWAATEFSTLSSWTAAAGQFEVEDFESLPVEDLSCPTENMFPCLDEVVLNTPLLEIVVPTGSDLEINPIGIVGSGRIDGTQELLSDLHAGVLVISNALLFRGHSDNRSIWWIRCRPFIRQHTTHPRPRAVDALLGRDRPAMPFSPTERPCRLAPHNNPLSQTGSRLA